MKIFDGMFKFFESLVEYIKNFSNLFLIFLGAFLLLSIVIIIMTSFAYECKLTKTIDKINKFLERNPRINDDNLVAFNNMMKASGVPKTLRRQWQQFMLYREHPASYYMSFKHCVENPLRNSTYNQQMTVYRVISLVLVVLSLVLSVFMTVDSWHGNRVLMDVLLIPITILVLYWLISMVLNLIHSAVSGDLFQNYQYFEINIDKAMLTLPEFVDYEVLFSQDEIRRGIPVLFAYLQKRAIQEQQELEKARLKSVDHEKFDFDEAGLDGSLVLDRAMRETENYTSQRKKYMQEIERVNNEIVVLENNYREQTKEFQRQVQTSKETVENLKEQLEQATSTIEINYIKKQMRDELNRQQLSEKDFDTLTDKHNQEIKALNQEIKHYEEEIKSAKEAMEVAMLSEFNTYSVKVYDNLEKIVDEKMQDRVDDYKDQIKDLEIELEEKNEELENVYSRYQEVLAEVPGEAEPIEEGVFEEVPMKKGKKKKKDTPTDNGMVQPEQVDEYIQPQYDEQYYNENVNYEDGLNGDGQYYNEAYNGQNYEYDQQYASETGDYDNQNYSYDEPVSDYNYDQYVPMDENQEGYVPVSEDYEPAQYAQNDQDYIPLQDENNLFAEDYIPVNDNQETDTASYENDLFATEYSEADNNSPINKDYFAEDDSITDENADDDDLINPEYIVSEESEEKANNKSDELESFDDTDFDIDFNKPTKTSADFDNMDFDFDFGDKEIKTKEEKVANYEQEEPIYEQEDEGDIDLNKILGLYESDSNNKSDKSDDDKDFSTPSVPAVKRGVGRPRKVVDEAEVAPKRKVGRPRKETSNEEIKPKRGPGRPRKVVEEMEVAPKRKVGRPRKSESIDKPMAKRPGRPRKSESIDKPMAKRPGRPRKVVDEAEVAPKRKVGRPKKQVAKTNIKPTQLKKRGRPRKQESNNTATINQEGVLARPKRKVGRPRKSDK